MLLSSHVALFREVYLGAAVHVMAHVGQRYKSRLVYDPSYPQIDHSDLRNCDWSEFYRDAEEAIPMNTPEARVKEVYICIFVSSDHAGDEVSCRSRSGFLIYMNTTLVQLLSKKQSTVETSVFGADFVTMKKGINSLRGFR